ncbi:MAG TPA: M23 family metallopeptidase [Pyrinomonadaceae bacterium]|jgi:murein DD-endopeptidase MepM/ murein hydrolase activator NlpD|nr:M23 family metallopeptidase [Pyrinomonadaceae bacterium]
MVTLKLWLAALLTPLVPFAAAVWLWRRRAAGVLDRLLAAATVAALSLVTFIAAPWAMTSYYLRYALAAAFALATYSSLRKGLEAHARGRATPDRAAGVIRVALLVVLLSLDALALKSYFYAVAPVELSFPLSGGVYYVMQGGNSRITNPFHRGGADAREDYALDIVKLDHAGRRAAGVVPRRLDAYAVYGETIRSPCDGEIVELFDGVPDNAIGDGGRNPSNHLVVRCKGVRVTLAHETPGSFLVREGERVADGQPLARVGSSGRAIEPHLHIDAVRDAAGDASQITPVPVSFGGRMLSTNSIITR